MEEHDSNDGIVNHFWVELVELKASIYYHIRLRRRDNTLDIATKIIPALAASGGIIAWLVKNEFGFYWAILIVLSHLLTAIKHLFPFEIRRDKTFELVFELSRIYLLLEKDWERIMDGMLTKEEISKLLFDTKKKLIDIEHKLLPAIIIPLKKSLIEAAKEDAKTYFSARYPVL
jgi:hypothetical protein